MGTFYGFTVTYFFCKRVTGWLIASLGRSDGKEWLLAVSLGLRFYSLAWCQPYQFIVSKIVSFSLFSFLTHHFTTVNSTTHFSSTYRLIF